MSSWQQQTTEPLFNDLLWSRPQNKKNAGKLLILGGHSHDMKAPILAYSVALKTGIGQAELVLPDSLPETVLKQAGVMPVVASKSGGISKKAEATIVQALNDFDAMLWPGAIGHDSETTQLIETIFGTTDKAITVTGDALTLVLNFAELAQRKETCWVVSWSQLREFVIKLKLSKALTSDITLNNFVELIQEITKLYPLSLATHYEKHLVVSFGGEVVTTPVTNSVKIESPDFEVELATTCAVLMVQFPLNKLAALATASWLLRGDST